MSWFEDDGDALPPIMKDGKEAYRAYVFTCPDGQAFVAYLERFTPEAKLAFGAMQQVKTEAEAAQALRAQAIVEAGQQFRKPGTSDWIPGNDRRFEQLTSPKCPDGTPAQRVTPLASRPQ